MSDVSLSASIRSNLVSLQKTSDLLQRTTTRLSTGKKVSSAVDNPTNYFAAVNYNDRADALSGRLDGMGEAIQQVKAADNGISTIRGFLSQMKGVVNDALAESNSSARNELGKQFNELIMQVKTVVKDSGYAGINLLTENQSRTVEFNENIGGSTLKMDGFNVSGGGTDSGGELLASAESAAGGSEYALTFDNGNGSASVIGIQSFGLDATGATGHEVNWGHTDAVAFKSSLSSVVGQIEGLEDQLKTEASKLANNLAVITQREDFTQQHINVLQEGADKLTLADLNEEGANLLSLQTASTLGVQSLSLASQQSQNVLRLVQ